ncbi:CBS domain-containing protein [Stetteria hydrogenophila]
MAAGRPGRPAFKRVSSARLSRGVSVSRSPVPIRRPEGIRWLRSDGSPNWSQRVAERAGELGLIASRPPVTVNSSSVILEAAETIADKMVRGLLVVDSKERLVGLLTALDLVNYLGGGEYYSIVANRYGYNIFKALREEKVTSIMTKNPPFLYRSDTLDKALTLMVREGVGMIPVLYEDGTVYGVVTEHDIIARLKGVRVGRKVSEIMSRTIVAVDLEDPIKKAAELMVKQGFRRLPVVDKGGEAQGYVSAKDYVAFFGSHKAFEAAATGSIEDVITNTRIFEIARRGLYTIRQDEDVGAAAEAMIEHGVNGLLVVDDEDNVVGIITERDVLLALAIEEV